MKRTLLRSVLYFAITFITTILSAQSPSESKPFQFCLMSGHLISPQASQNGQLAIALSNYIKVVNLGKDVNTKGFDYAPVVSHDGATLYYVSDREGSIPKKNGENSHDIWSLRLRGTGLTNENIPFNIAPTPQFGNSSLNTSSNEGALTLTFNRQRIYFTGCSRPDGKGDCDIYYCDIQPDGSWGKAINCGGVNSSYFDSQPSISPDSKRLYFISNRPDASTIAYKKSLAYLKQSSFPSAANALTGLNQTTQSRQSLHIESESAKLWYSLWDDEKNTWGSPREVAALNPPNGRVYSPFVCADNRTMFFASDGYNDNMGGMDIYVTRMNEDSTWIIPVNLGSPINSRDDEVFITLPYANNVAYFSSTRKDDKDAQGRYDLYMACVVQECTYGDETRQTPVMMNEGSKVKVGYTKQSNTVTMIVELSTNATLTLKVYDLLGKEVMTCINGQNFTSGRHTVPLRIDNIASGAYFFMLEANNETITNGFVISR